MNRLLFVFASILFFSCSNDKADTVKTTPVVDVINPTVEDVTIYEEFVGQVYGEVDIPIRTRVAGFLEGIHFSEGLTVKKDQLLYSIDPQPLEADLAAQTSKLAEAKTEMIRTENELIRYEELIKTKAVSQSDYDAAKAEAEAAKAGVDAAQANVRSAEINLGYCKMYSPIDGIIGQTMAKVGEFVGRDPNPVILNTVSHVMNVRVLFHLTEKQYLNIARVFSVFEDDQNSEDSSNYNLKLILADGSYHKYPGKIDFINREVDATTGSMLVQASFPNPNRILRPGQYAKVEAAIRVIENAVLVPQRCVKELQGGYSLQVLNDSSRVITQGIVLGGRKGSMVVVKEGINKNSKVLFTSFSGPSTVLVEENLVTYQAPSKSN
ncbi:MAG: efflux RND transporter periplasmic adaptor subunit [Salibacteraceae bacterium]